MVEARTGSGSSNSSTAGLGPFRGDREGYARLFVWLASVEGLMLLVFPWVLVRILSLHHHHFNRDLFLGMPEIFFRLGVVDVFALITALNFWIFWRRLNAKIAEGGAEAAFLDKTRMHVAALLQQGMVMLLLVTLISLSPGM
jgi:hypothetical protein